FDQFSCTYNNSPSPKPPNLMPLSCRATSHALRTRGGVRRRADAALCGARATGSGGVREIFWCATQRRRAREQCECAAAGPRRFFVALRDATRSARRDQWHRSCFGNAFAKPQHPEGSVMFNRSDVTFLATLGAVAMVVWSCERPPTPVGPNRPMFWGGGEEQSCPTKKFTGGGRIDPTLPNTMIGKVTFG